MTKHLQDGHGSGTTSTTLATPALSWGYIGHGTKVQALAYRWYGMFCVQHFDCKQEPGPAWGTYIYILKTFK